MFIQTTKLTGKKKFLKSHLCVTRMKIYGKSNNYSKLFGFPKILYVIDEVLKIILTAHILMT